MKTVVRWTGAVIGALVLAFLIVIAWGSSLPIHHTASCDATLRAPVDAVWNAIADERSWVPWGTPNCGKGEPMQTGRTAQCAAPARFRGVRVGVGYGG